MANKDQPCGFKPHGEVLRVTPYRAAGTIYPGDAVKRSAGGAVSTGFYPDVVVATAGAAMIGVAATYAGSAGDTVLVYDHPEQLFSGQGDEGDLDQNADLGKNASILATAGNATYKMSRMEIDSNTIAANAGLELLVLGIERRIDNALGTNCRVIFKINMHQLGGAVGVGV